MRKLVSLTIMTATIGLATTAAVAATGEVTTKTTTVIKTAAVKPQEVTKAYTEAMKKMHKPMMEGVKATNPDVAFVQGMIPHHQGAIDMAQLELKYGTDPELRKLAESIIADQQKEIALMHTWMANHQDLVKKAN